MDKHKIILVNQLLILLLADLGIYFSQKAYGNINVEGIVALAAVNLTIVFSVAINTYSINRLKSKHGFRKEMFLNYLIPFITILYMKKIGVWGVYIANFDLIGAVAAVILLYMIIVYGILYLGARVKLAIELEKKKRKEKRERVIDYSTGGEERD